MAENQPGSGTDIELWVAGNTTSLSGLSHSSRWPLQAVMAGGGSSAPPVARKLPAAASTSSAAAAPATILRARWRVAGPAGAASGSSAAAGARSGSVTSRRIDSTPL